MIYTTVWVMGDGDGDDICIMAGNTKETFPLTAFSISYFRSVDLS